ANGSCSTKPVEDFHLLEQRHARRTNENSQQRCWLFLNFSFQPPLRHALELFVYESEHLSLSSTSAFFYLFES
ncbi:hypothetical protein, partial [Photobacterium damselae]|uniref:hypothetical protein n=1 Tax=Photobacterium damselae TaxID=38293 RepID=UPI001ADDF5AC